MQNKLQRVRDSKEGLSRNRLPQRGFGCKLNAGRTPLKHLNDEIPTPCTHTAPAKIYWKEQFAPLVAQTDSDTDTDTECGEGFKTASTCASSPKNLPEADVLVNSIERFSEDGVAVMALANSRRAYPFNSLSIAMALAEAFTLIIILFILARLISLVDAAETIAE